MSSEMSLIQIESYDKWLNNLFVRLGLIDVNSVLMTDPFLDEESSDKYLIGLDPKDWKNQDHYRILNISKRFLATPEEIKKQCIYQFFLNCYQLLTGRMCSQTVRKCFGITRTRGPTKPEWL